MRKNITLPFFLLLFLFGSLQAQSQSTLTVTPTSLGGFTTAQGTPSAQQALAVSGNNLTGNVTATAPGGFEVSWTSGASFGNSVVLTQSGGVVSNVPLYVRMTGAVLGPINGNVTIATAGAAAQLVAVSGNVTSAPTPNPQSTLTGISPTSGLGGTQVLVTFYGSNFVPGAYVGLQFNFSGFITATYVSSTQLTALVTLPSVTSPTVTYFIAANPTPGGGGGSTRMMFFTINPGPPTITSFSPASGPPGTEVTIRGTNLSLPSGNGSTIAFNGTPAAASNMRPSESIHYTRVPAGATTGFITLTNDNGAAVSPTQFVVTAAPPALFENFESGTKTSYAAASVQLQSGGWTFGESLIGTTSGADKFNGAKSARLRGGGFIEMDTDKPNGAGIVTVSAAGYATETGASFVPEISTDGGVTYTSLLGSSAPPALTATLTQYSFTANRTGNVRLRFRSTNTAATTNPRINLDDVGITDYRVGTATRPAQALADVQAAPNPARDHVLISGAGTPEAFVALYDLLGRRVLASTPLQRGTLALPKTLPAGAYLLHVQTRYGYRVIRISKE